MPSLAPISLVAAATIATTAALSPALAAQKARKAPRVLSLTPANGAMEVDAAKATQLIVKFDQPMSKRGHSICGGGPQFPKLKGRPRWKGKDTMILEVQLKPDHTYRLSLNCPAAMNTRSAKGTALVPVPWSFTTLPTKLRESKVQKARNREAFAAAHEALASKYSYYEHKKIDWPAQFKQHEKAILSAKTDRGWAQAMATMLKPCADLHLYLRIGDQTIGTASRRIDPLYRSKHLAKHLTGIGQPTQGITTARTKDGIAYLMISGWSRKIDFDAVEEWIAANRKAKAMVIDVRPNSGGDESLAMRVAQWFVSGTKTYAKHATRKGPGPRGFYNVSHRKIRGKPKAERFRKPVAVLMSRYCMSSNEAFLLMMRQAEKSKLIGQTSYGSSGNPRPHAMPNGVQLVLPSWKVMRLDGTCFEGEGLKPDLEIVPSAKDLEKGDPILAKALAHLRQQK